mgnify:CR=1 FL=1
MPEDHFSRQAFSYARVRPRYPAALFAHLAALAPATGCAWDCATGNGQAAVGLAEHFDLVHATDLSAEQIAHAAVHPRVRYHVAPAEASGLPDGCADVVTVATPKLGALVNRVNTSDRIAPWTYGAGALMASLARRGVLPAAT